MTGYILPIKQELKVREFETYNAYYCGLCREVGETYGQLTRLWLSNDMAFLALFLGALTGEDDHILKKHCIIHPIGKKPVETIEQSIRYAADMMVILGYEQYRDDVRDNERSELQGRLLRYKRRYRRAYELHPDVADEVNRNFMMLYQYEVKGQSDIKEMASCFGGALAAVFSGYKLDDETKRIVGDFALNLGKWLYLIDIMDDFESDRMEHRFNPMLDMGVRNVKQARQMMEPAMYYYLDEMCKAYDLLEFKKNKDILDNVIFLGLRKRTEEILSGKESEDNDK